MATCPRCKGHLTDSHRCPRRPLVAAAEILACALAGGVAGLLLVVLFDPHGEPHVDMLSIIAGAMIAIGLDRSLRQ